VDLIRRQKFLRAQRDKIVAKRKQEKQKELADFRQEVQEASSAPQAVDTKATPKVDPVRAAIAKKYKEELEKKRNATDQSQKQISAIADIEAQIENLQRVRKRRSTELGAITQGNPVLMP